MDAHDNCPPEVEEPVSKSLKIDESPENKLNDLQVKLDQQTLKMSQLEYDLMFWKQKYTEVNKAFTFVLSRSKKVQLQPPEDFITLKSLRDRLPDHLIWLIDCLKRVYSAFGKTVF